jgi:monomeric isocitrate dehydrogenase
VGPALRLPSSCHASSPSRAPDLFAARKKTPQRAHDAQVLAKVTTYLAQPDTQGLDIKILTPAAHSLSRLPPGSYLKCSVGSKRLRELRK